MQNPGDNEIQSGPDNDDRMSAEKQRRILPLERRASVGDEFHFFLNNECDHDILYI
jgi:hypothetical protein